MTSNNNYMHNGLLVKLNNKTIENCTVYEHWCPLHIIKYFLYLDNQLLALAIAIATVETTKLRCQFDVSQKSQAVQQESTCAPQILNCSQKKFSCQIIVPLKVQLPLIKIMEVTISCTVFVRSSLHNHNNKHILAIYDACDTMTFVLLSCVSTSGGQSETV